MLRARELAGCGAVSCRSCVIPLPQPPTAAVPPDPAARLGTPTPNKGRTAPGTTNDGLHPGRRFSGRGRTTPFVPPDGESRFPLCRLQWCSGGNCSALSGSAAPCNSAALQLTHCSYMTGSFVLSYGFIHSWYRPRCPGTRGRGC